jgi:hypothetical protein
MSDFLNLHNNLSKLSTDKVNYAENNLFEGKLKEPVWKNDLLIGQKRFESPVTSTVVHNSAGFEINNTPIDAKHKMIEFNGEMYYIRTSAHSGGSTAAGGLIYKYDYDTDTWAAIFRLPTVATTYGYAACDAIIYQNTLWIAISYDVADVGTNVRIWRWNGTTFFNSHNLSHGSGRTYELSFAVYNEQLWLGSASSTNTYLWVYDGNTWHGLKSHAPGGAGAFHGTKLIVFQNHLYWFQASINNLIYVSKYRNNDATSGSWIINDLYTTFDIGFRPYKIDVVEYNNNLIIWASDWGNRQRLTWTPNAHSWYRMDFSWVGNDGPSNYTYRNNLRDHRFFKTSDNELFMISGNSDGMIDMWQIHDQMNTYSTRFEYQNSTLMSRWSISHVHKLDTITPFGGQTYTHDIIEFNGRILLGRGGEGVRQHFLKWDKIDLIKWTSAFKYQKNNDYEVALLKFYEGKKSGFGWFAERNRGVALKEYNGELFMAISSVFYPRLLTYKLINDNWVYIPQPLVLPADAYGCSMEVHDNELYLAVANWSSTSRVITYQWSGTQWDKLVDLDENINTARHVQMKSHTNGNMYMVVSYHGTSPHARTYRWNGSTWENFVIPNITGTTGRNALESHGEDLYLACAQWTSGTRFTSYKLNPDGFSWTQVVINGYPGNGNTCYATALKSFKDELYMSVLWDGNRSRIWKLNSSTGEFDVLPTPLQFYNSTREAIEFFEYEDRLFLLRGDSHRAPHWQMYSLEEGSTTQFKPHKRWMPFSGVVDGLGYAQWQFAAEIYQGRPYFAYVNDADGWRPHLQILTLTRPDEIVSLLPRNDIKTVYGYGIATEDGKENDTILIKNLSPNYGLYKNDDWEYMSWELL